MDAQQQLFGLMAVAEEQQRAVQAAIDGLKQERTAITRTVNTSAEQIASLITDASTTAQQHADAAIDRFHGKWSSVIWKAVLAAVVTVSAICGMVAWAQRYHVGELLEQKAALKIEVATLERQAAALAKKGGRIELTTCTDNANVTRTCIRIAANQGAGNESFRPPFKNPNGSQFVIPAGY
jgi:hypothetical protein